MHPTLRRVALFALVIAFAAPAALASGFHIYEQDAKASGQAVAFVARADNASAIYYNPAAMTQFDGIVVSGGFSAVFLGETTFDSADSGQRWDMLNHTPIIAHLYYGVRIPNSRFALGVSYGNPFGLVTDWSLPGFDGRFSAWKTDLRTHLININGAADLGAGWSVALGADYLQGDLRSFSRFILAEVPVPLDLNADGTTDITRNAYSEVFSDFAADGDEWGWNAAVHFKAKDWSAGLTYRSGFKVQADGTAGFSVGPVDVSEFPALPPEVLAGIQVKVAGALAAGLPTGGASGTLNLPGTIAAGVAYAGLPKWQFEFDVHQLQWSEFDKIPIDFQTNTPLLADKVINENWDDTTSYRLGASWDVAEQHQVRLGIYKEDSPIPKATLRPSIPDSERVGYTAGYGFHTGKFAVDVYYMHIQLDDMTVGAAEIDPADPVPLGTYKSKIDLAGLTASYKF